MDGQGEVSNVRYKGRRRGLPRRLDPAREPDTGAIKGYITLKPYFLMRFQRNKALYFFGNIFFRIFASETRNLTFKTQNNYNHETT